VSTHEAKVERQSLRVLLGSGGEAALIWHRPAERPDPPFKNRPPDEFRTVAIYWEQSQNSAHDAGVSVHEAKVERQPLRVAKIQAAKPHYLHRIYCGLIGIWRLLNGFRAAPRRCAKADKFAIANPILA